MSTLPPPYNSKASSVDTSSQVQHPLDAPSLATFSDSQLAKVPDKDVPSATLPCTFKVDESAPTAEPAEDVLAWVSRNQIRIRTQIRFAFNSAQIHDDSLPILDAVAKVLLAHPTMCIEVQAHTDSVGSRAYNLKLTQDRAEAVVQALVQKGIDKSRLSAHGYGPDRPISHPPGGQHGNRRIEFVISTLQYDDP